MGKLKKAIQRQGFDAAFFFDVSIYCGCPFQRKSVAKKCNILQISFNQQLTFLTP